MSGLKEQAFTTIRKDKMKKVLLARFRPREIDLSSFMTFRPDLPYFNKDISHFPVFDPDGMYIHRDSIPRY